MVGSFYKLQSETWACLDQLGGLELLQVIIFITTSIIGLSIKYASVLISSIGDIRCEWVSDYSIQF